MEAKIINGYTLLAPFDSKDAGFCQWTFGRRDGQVYFIKEFNDPVYPDETTLSPVLRQSRIRECMEFEDRKRRLYHSINELSDGNVVRIEELFRWESHYYLVTGKVMGEEIGPEELSRLPLQDRLLLCRTAAHALMRVHEGGIVHGDIKQSNVLLQKTSTGKLTAKLIDFDASFFENEPPEEGEDLHFDQVYLAPEGYLFINGEPVELTCKMDVFSMGLLMHEYLTGELPHFGSGYEEAYEAVLDGHTLELDPSLPPKVREILGRMLLSDPEERCTMEEVFRELGVFFGQEEKKEPEKEPDSKPVTTNPGDPMSKFFVPTGDL